MDDDKKKEKDEDKKEDKILVKMQARINELEAELKEKDEIILNYLNKKEDKKEDKEDEDEKSEDELFKERQKKRLEYYKKHLN